MKEQTRQSDEEILPWVKRHSRWLVYLPAVRCMGAMSWAMVDFFTPDNKKKEDSQDEDTGL